MSAAQCACCPLGGLSLRGAHGNEMYKAAVRERHSMLAAYGSCEERGQQGLNEMYVDLVIVRQWPEGEEELEIHLKKKGQCHRDYLKQRGGQDRRISIQALFQAGQEGNVPKTVLLDGIPGIGKTCTAQKVILEWASDKLYNELFSLVFYVRCSDVEASQDDVSLSDVLFRDFQGPLQTLKEAVLAGPGDVLIILDGLSKVEMSDEQMPPQVVSLDSKLPPCLLLGQLLHRRVLPEVSLLITSRPGALSSTGIADRHATILGFSEEGQSQYFSKFFGSEHLASVAMDCLLRDEDLITMCFIPLVCLLVGRSLEPGSDTVQRLETTTQLLISFYTCLSGKAPLGWGQASSLTTLALNGVKEKKVLFDMKDLKTHDIQPMAATSSFLNQVSINGGQKGPYYCFAHLIFQELFAAACCVGNREVAEPMKLVEDLLHSEIERQNLNDCLFELFLHQIPVEPLFARIADVTHLYSTLGFIFGLMDGELAGRLMLDPRPELLEKLLDWIQRALAANVSEKMSLFLYGCLYEIHQERFVQSALKNKDGLSLHSSPSRPINYTDLTYCLPRCKDMKFLSLSCCNLGIHGLSSVLRELPKCASKLETLHLHEDTFGNEGIILLCPVLKTMNLKTLSLWNNNLTDDCMEDLSLALQEMPRLEVLDLQTNKFQDGCVPGLVGITEKCRALRTLFVLTNQLTGEGVARLIEGLKLHGSNLAKLGVGSNHLGDEGGKLVSEALKLHGPNLQELLLGRSDLTDACAEDLASALTANPLLSVDLTDNCFTDRSIPIFLPVINRIWSGFKHFNKFSPEGQRVLSDAARKATEAPQGNQKSSKLVRFINKLKGLRR
ncbi:NACHT, LRR and PYD domains-containing protein 3-like isoform X2 [Ambystoma mexicanum]|uniref:NACHT, LRR and PYD domains-containing protein 3-like isoform X2 n=1 Tax=Ambystoma mexicanum TaxID=8296 RepID=UPI0037E8B6B0